MALFVLRIWLDDRPGALGAVASRIGAVKGDLVGIEILERGGGRAIDELLVDLANPELVSLMAREISEVDGADVEDIRPASDGMRDVRISALSSIATLMEMTSSKDFVSELIGTVIFDFESDWSCLIRPKTQEMLVTSGEVPTSSWLSAFVEGTATLGNSGDILGPGDVAWAPLAGSELVVVVGREKRPYRAIEREQLRLICRIADVRYRELLAKSAG